MLKKCRVVHEKTSFVKSLKHVQVKSDIRMLILNLSEILWDTIQYHNLLMHISNDVEHKVLTI